MFGFGPIAKFKGDDGAKIELYKDHIECKGESHSLNGIVAYVESGSDLESRVTLTRLIAVGLFAFAFKKRKGGEKYLTIEGPDFAWMSMVGRKHIPEGMHFMSDVNDAARKTPIRAAEEPIENIAESKASRHIVSKEQRDTLIELNQRYAAGEITFGEFMSQKNALL